jgi:endonuclease/exonuclease/phosphatase (EEP) superfamily protein YafD
LPSGDTVHLYEIHPPPPVMPSYARQRDNEIALMGQVLQKDKAAYRILLGDFNCTIFSPHMARLLEQSNLRHAQRDYRLGGTWPNLLPAFLRIGIDQTLVSPHISVEERNIGPYLGSDHMPVLTRLDLYAD